MRQEVNQLNKLVVRSSALLSFSQTNRHLIHSIDNIIVILLITVTECSMIFINDCSYIDNLLFNNYHYFISPKIGSVLYSLWSVY